MALEIQLDSSEPDRLLIPVSPHFSAVFREYWTKTQGRFHFASQTGPWTAMADPEAPGIKKYPVMDDMVAVIILPINILGKTPCLNSPSLCPASPMTPLSTSGLPG